MPGESIFSDPFSDSPSGVGLDTGTIPRRPTSIFTDPNEDQQLAATVRQAQATPPDTAGRVLQLQAKTGIPATVISRNLDTVERQAAGQSFDPGTLRRESPALASWLQVNPMHAAVAQDDLPTLSTLERTLQIGGQIARRPLYGAYHAATTSLWNVIKNLADTADATNEAITGVQAGGGVLGAIGAYAGKAAAASEGTATDIGGTVPANANWLERQVYSGLESVGQMVPGMLLSVATGNPEFAVIGQGVQTGADAMTQAREQGVPMGRAAVYGVNQGALEALTEWIPAEKLFTDLAEHAGLVRTIAHQILPETIGEEVATATQNFNDWVNLPANTDKPFSAFVAEMPEAALGTLVAVAVTVAAHTSIAHGTARILGTLGTAQAQQRVVEGMHAAAEASKTRERAPEAFTTLVEQMTENGLKDVQVPAAPFAEYFQSKGLDPATVAAQLTGNPDAYRLAMASDGDLVIPTANYLSQVMGSGHEAFFAKELRLSPDSMNARETHEALKTEAALPAEGTPAPKDEAATIHADLVTRLVESGRMAQATAERVATVISEAFPNIASRTGIDLPAIVAKYLPEVQGVQSLTPDTTDPVAFAAAVASARASAEAPPAAAGHSNQSLDFTAQPSQTPPYAAGLEEDRRVGLAGSIADGGVSASRPGSAENEPSRYIRRKPGESQASIDRRRQAFIATAREERRSAHLDTTFDYVAHSAQQLDPAVDPVALRREFDFRLGYWEEQSEVYAESGHDPLDLLREIARRGGINIEDKSYPGEVRLLAEGQRFGKAQGVKGVFRSDGMSVEVLATDLAGDEQRFGWIENVYMLLDALDDAIRHPIPEQHIIPGTHELAAVLGIDPSVAWWRDAWAGEPVADSLSADAIDAGGDESFDPTTFEQRSAIPALFDTLPTGEEQPRLPGAEHVREQDIATPTFEAPFTLVSQTIKAKKGRQDTLFQAQWHRERLARVLDDAVATAADAGYDAGPVSPAMAVELAAGTFDVASSPALGEAAKSLGVPNTAEGWQRYFAQGEQTFDQAGATLSRESGDGYQQDLFGNPLEGPLRADRGGSQAVGDVHAASDLQRDDVAGQFPTRTQLVAQGTRTLGASHVVTPAAAAAATAYLARGAQERFDALVVDADGTPLAVVGAFKGTVNATVAHPEIVVAEAVRIKGAAAIWFAHNHPSGEPALSTDDRAVAQRFAEAFRGTGIVAKGILAIGSGEEGQRRFEHYDPDSGTAMSGAVRPATGRTQVPVLEREFVSTGKLAERITTDTEALAAVPQIARGEFGAVLLDNRSTPIGFLPVDPTMAGELRKDGRLDALYRGISVSGAASAIIHSTGPATAAAALNLANAFQSMNVHALDIIGHDAQGDAFSTQSARGLRLTGKFAQTTRGSITFRDGDAPLIKLFSSRNRSTFLHETGHLFLGMMGDITEQLRGLDPATLTEAQQKFITDYQTALDAVGATAGQPLTTEQHEQWARMFEAFVMEGKAPSIALRSVFQRARTWLVTLYKNLAGLSRDAGTPVVLTDDVRAVMDRLLATDEAIAEAQADAGGSSLVTHIEAAGIPDAEVNGYRAKVQAAAAAATDRLQTKVMADLAREEKAWWQDERAIVREEVAIEVQSQPVYKALAAMQKGTTPGGAPLNTDGKPPTPLKLSKDALVAQFGKEILAKLPKPYVYSKEGGLHPDVAAELLGFPSGQALLDAVIAAPKMDRAIDTETDNRMHARHGDLVTDPAQLAEQARQAIADDHRDTVVRAEIAMLNKLRAAAAPSVRAERQAQSAQRKAGVARVRGEMPDAATLQRQAQAQVASMTIRDIRPDRFWASARTNSRLATQSAAAQDFDAAVRAKQSELINLALFREATLAHEEIASALEGFKALQKSDTVLAKTHNLDLVNAARAILAQYGIGTAKAAARSEAMLGQLRTYDPGAYEQISEQIDAATASAGPYRDIPMRDFRAMAATVDGIWGLAGTSEQILVNGQRLALTEVRQQVAAQLHQFSTARPAAGLTHAVTTWDRVKVGLLGFKARLRRVEDWVTVVDNGRTGIAHDAVYAPISDAAVRYDSARTDVAQRYLAIAQTVDAATRYRQIAAPEIGYTFKDKHQELLGTLLHTGNGFEPGSNGYKLLVGRNWGVVGEDGSVDTSRWKAFEARMQREGILTRADYDYAQQVWDLNESLKPDAQQTHKARFGRYFDEVTAVPFATPFGEYRGGYYPAMADPFITPEAANRAEATALMEGGAGGSLMFPTVNRGFTKTRTLGYAKPLILDSSMVLSHLNAVLKFTHLSQPVHEVARLILHPSLRNALDAVDPATVSDMLKPFLDRAATQSMYRPMEGRAGRAADTVARYVRTAGSAQIIALNATVLAEQFTHMPSVLAHPDVEGTGLLSALWQLSRGPRSMARDINDASPFMETRTSAGLVDAHEALNRILLDPNPAQRASTWVRDHATVVMRTVQEGMDMLVWRAVYDKVANEPDATHDDAVRRADSAVRQALGSYRPADRSAIEGGNQMLGLLNMFYGFFNTKANMLGTEAVLASRMGAGRKYSRAFAIYSVGFMVPAVLGKVIKTAMGSRPWKDDDEDAAVAALRFWWDSQFEMGARMVPFGGAAVTAFEKSFEKGKPSDILNAPAVKTVEDALHAPGEAYHAITDEESTRAQGARAVTDIFTLLGMLSGIPMRPIGQAVNTVNDLENPQ